MVVYSSQSSQRYGLACVWHVCIICMYLCGRGTALFVLGTFITCACTHDLAVLYADIVQQKQYRSYDTLYSSIVQQYWVYDTTAVFTFTTRYYNSTTLLPTQYCCTEKYTIPLYRVYREAKARPPLTLLCTRLQQYEPPGRPAGYCLLFAQGTTSGRILWYHDMISLFKI